MEFLHDKKEFDMKVYGNICTAAPWAALCFGVSAIRMMCSEFAGLRWRASLECSQHQEEMGISDVAIRPGDKLLLGESCSLCSPVTGGLGEAETELLEVVDVLQGRGEVLRATHEIFIKLQLRYPVLGTEAPRGLHPEQAQRRFDDSLNGMKEEVNGLLRRAQEPTQENDVGGDTKMGEPGGVCGDVEEVAKLRLLVEDAQNNLGQQHQDVRGWLGTAGMRFAHGIDADDGVMGKLDFVVDMLMAVRRDGFDTPRRACFLPPWEQFAWAHGLSEHEQSPKVWVSRLNEWREDDFKAGKGFFKKKKHLFLVCAHPHRLVPCGPNGQGYDIQQFRAWFRRSISVATFALKVVCSTLVAMAATPLSGAGAAVEATVSTAIGSFESLVEAQLAGLTLDDDGADVAVWPQLERRAFPSLREFIHGVEDTARVEIAKAKRGRGAASSPSGFVFFEQKMAQVQRRARDAAVQWVLKGRKCVARCSEICPICVE